MLHCNFGVFNIKKIISTYHKRSIPSEKTWTAAINVRSRVISRRTDATLPKRNPRVTDQLSQQ